MSPSQVNTASGEIVTSTRCVPAGSVMISELSTADRPAVYSPDSEVAIGPVVWVGSLGAGVGVGATSGVVAECVGSTDSVVDGAAVVEVVAEDWGGSGVNDIDEVGTDIDGVALEGTLVAVLVPASVPFGSSAAVEVAGANFSSFIDG
ncbi:hypothetical protein [Rhodococcus sp. H29-C3]|uniref:hypothetical protein n=1 Tax=Rhodococcus sp. H29-C3 TaxID=3046307 RepID=UPI0024B9B8D6|nr:hypothetical protein [Rhodococcus sp. H29-C3]MDJ0359117.1 hypothetical protein [Rhodococcus sp. H29-C3]